MTKIPRPVPWTSFTTRISTVAWPCRPNQVPQTWPVNNLNNPGVSGQVYGLAVLPNDETIIAGNFSSYNGWSQNNIALLNNDGSMDTTFNPGRGAQRLGQRHCAFLRLACRQSVCHRWRLHVLQWPGCGLLCPVECEWLAGHGFFTILGFGRERAGARGRGATGWQGGHRRRLHQG